MGAAGPGEEHSHERHRWLLHYLAATCVYYGITSGILATGTWQAYSDVDTEVG
jgi:hypothetical protein